MKSVVVFNASWCNTCGPFKKQLTDNGITYLSASLDDVVDDDVAKVFGVNPGIPVMSLAATYHVRSLPTTLVLEDKQVVEVIVGSKLQEVKNALGDPKG